MLQPTRAKIGSVNAEVVWIAPDYEQQPPSAYCFLRFFVADVHIGAYPGGANLRYGDLDTKGATRTLAMMQAAQIMRSAVSTNQPELAWIDDRGSVLRHRFTHHTRLVVAGDFYDKPSPPAVYANTASILPFESVAGNHDLSAHSLDQSALWSRATVRNAFGMHPIAYVHYSQCSRQIDYLYSRFTGLPSGVTTAVAHVGVWDDSTPTFMQNHHDAVAASDLFSVMENTQITCAVVGNWHAAKIFSRGHRVIVQCGTLCPVGWNDTGPDNGFVHVAVSASHDLPVFAILRIPLKGIPQFETVPYSDDCRTALMNTIAAIVARSRIPMVRLSHAPSETAEATAIAASFAPFYVEPYVSTASVRTATQELGEKLRSRVDMDAALRDFIDKTPYPQDIRDDAWKIATDTLRSVRE
jgi:hypothetical protein